MDSLTHALIITIILAMADRPDLIPFGIMGAVLIDIDVVFSFFSNRDPRLYIFTHGGFTHSILGAFDHLRMHSFFIRACIADRATSRVRHRGARRH